MCGIAGIFHPQRALAESGVAAMTAAQTHRGPDDEGIEIFLVPDGFLALGQRRLAILDLSPAGHQPMTHPDTGDWIVLNDEISGRNRDSAGFPVACIAASPRQRCPVAGRLQGAAGLQGMSIMVAGISCLRMIGLC